MSLADVKRIGQDAGRVSVRFRYRRRTYTPCMAKREGKNVFRRVEGELLGEQAPRREAQPLPAPPPPRKRPSLNLFTPDPDASPLERALGPGCFLSLIIVALLLVGFRRIGSLPPPMLAIIALIVFFLVLFILLRMRPVRIQDGKPPTRRR